MLLAVPGVRWRERRSTRDWRMRLRGWALAAMLVVSAPAFAVDLAITDLSDTGSDPTPAGGVVTYSITVENASADTSADTFVLFDIPPGTTAVGLPPFCTVNATVPTRIECDLGALDGVLIGGDPVTFQIQIDTGALPPGLISIDAAIGQAPLPDPTVPLSSLPDSDPFFAADTNQTNNRASQSTTLIDSADLSLEKSATPNPVVAGGIVTFTIAVTNNGPSPSTNFSVQDSLPAGLVYIDGSATGTGWTFTGPNGTFAGTLPAGQTATYTFQAQATASSGSLINSATVTPTGTPDPDSSNNSDSVDVGITAGADLAIGKTVTAAVGSHRIRCDGSVSIPCEKGESRRLSAISCRSSSMITNTSGRSPLPTAKATLAKVTEFECSMAAIDWASISISYRNTAVLRSRVFIFTFLLWRCRWI